MTLLAVGDSVMQGAGPELYATLPAALPGIEVDAVPYRQLRHGAAVVSGRTGPAPSGLVVHLGTNGVFGDGAFDTLVLAAGAHTPVWVVTVRAPRPWADAVNAALARGVDRHRDRATLVDWHARATDDDLCPDGFHLTRRGARAYAEVIAAAVHAAPSATAMLAP